jgi:hypothetical protein
MTLALATAAPVGSVTTPRTAAVKDWLQAEPVIIKSKQPILVIDTRIFIGSPFVE